MSNLILIHTIHTLHTMYKLILLKTLKIVLVLPDLKISWVTYKQRNINLRMANKLSGPFLNVAS